MPSRTSKVRFSPGKSKIALLELLDDPQRVQIVIKVVAVLAHAQIQLLFSRMPKRRMPDVMNQRKRLGKVGVKPQRVGNGARDLRHFECVRQPVAKMVGDSAW